MLQEHTVAVTSLYLPVITTNLYVINCHPGVK